MAAQSASPKRHLQESDTDQDGYTTDQESTKQAKKKKRAVPVTSLRGISDFGYSSAEAPWVALSATPLFSIIRALHGSRSLIRLSSLFLLTQSFLVKISHRRLSIFRDQL